MPDPVYYYILNQLKLPITTATEVRSDFSFLPYSNLQGMTVLGRLLPIRIQFGNDRLQYIPDLKGKLLYVCCGSSR